MRALVLQNDPLAPPALVGAALEQLGFRLDVVQVWRDGAPELGRPDLLLALGSSAAAHDDAVPWLAGELALLRAAAAADVPTWGICFGCQALARALGGAARRANTGELGFVRVRSDDPELIPTGPWFQWHDDTFDVPPGGELLARTDALAQALRVGRAIGTQFHPEVDAALLATWLDRLEAGGGRPPGELPALRAEVAEHAERLGPAAADLTARIVADVCG